jgi:uncharacterized membrane protein
MLKIVTRGIAMILLEIGTAAFTLALFAVILSAYITARVVGVTPKSNRTAAMVRVARDLLAMGIDAKRRASAPFPDVDDVGRTDA